MESNTCPLPHHYYHYDDDVVHWNQNGYEENYQLGFYYVVVAVMGDGEFPPLANST
jgi:hypothetical protein